MDVTAAERGRGADKGEAGVCSASAVRPQKLGRCSIAHPYNLFFYYYYLFFFRWGRKIRSPWEWRMGSNGPAGVEIPGTHVRLEKAAISAVLNTLHRNDGDVPKPLHDLAPNKHAADGKRAFGSPRPRSIPTSWGGRGDAGHVPAGPWGRSRASCPPCIIPGGVYPEIKPSSSPGSTAASPPRVIHR